MNIHKLFLFVYHMGRHYGGKSGDLSINDGELCFNLGIDNDNLPSILSYFYINSDILDSASYFEIEKCGWSSTLRIKIEIDKDSHEWESIKSYIDTPPIDVLQNTLEEMIRSRYISEENFPNVLKFYKEFIKDRYGSTY